MKAWLIFAAVAALLVASACTVPPTTLRVLAGSEVENLEPLFPEIEKATGVRLEMTYMGTLTGVEKLLAGEAFDAAWFSHGKYLELLGRERNLVVAQEKTMLSPVVMGVKQSVARAQGWLDNPDVTWQQIADASEAGKLRYAMTNPTASNSGFTALVGVATALTGSGDALGAGQVRNDALRGFFKGQALTAGSSGWLAESYVESQGALDGMVNYESVLLELNRSGRLSEQLALIYPKDGIITADYPLMLLNRQRRNDYDRLVSYLRSPEFQKKMMVTTLRRPAIPGVVLDERIPDRLLIELPFPTSADVIDALLFSYLDEQRVPAHAFFVLDVSGSMEGAGLRDLKTALNGLTGLDTSLTGRFARFRGREEITLIPFNHTVQPESNFRIENTDPEGPDMQAVRAYAERLEAGGNTAIYSAIARAYELAAKAQSEDPDRYYSVVLMSDGASNRGMTSQQFRAFLDALGPEARGIRAFTVVFGDAEPEAMKEIARLTGGRSFDGTRDRLDAIFKQIRGYQ
jgi:Ca-activated chloride channel family protein